MAFFEISLNSRTAKPVLDQELFSVKEDEGCYVVGRRGSAVFARIRKRKAYPGTYCYQQNQDTIVLGYGALDPQEDSEYLQVIVTRSGEVSICRDVYTTLPIFYGQSADTFVASNEYTVVCEGLPGLTLSREGVLETLLLNANCYKLMWEELHVLSALQRLAVDRDGSLTVESGPSRPWVLSRDAPQTDPHNFARLFAGHLDRVIEKISSENIAFEISGGLDSATLPLYWAARHGSIQSQAKAGALIFPGDFGISQRKKLQAIVDYTGLDIEQLSLDSIAHGMLGVF